MTANDDCTVIATICQSKVPIADLPGAYDMIRAVPHDQRPMGVQNNWHEDTQTTWCEREMVNGDRESGGKDTNECRDYIEGTGPKNQGTHDHRNDPMYLLEYATTAPTAGISITADGPTSKALFSEAAGAMGMIGNHAITIDKDSTKYMIDIKVLAGGHTGTADGSSEWLLTTTPLAAPFSHKSTRPSRLPQGRPTS